MGRKAAGAAGEARGRHLGGYWSAGTFALPLALAAVGLGVGAWARRGWGSLGLLVLAAALLEAWRSSRLELYSHGVEYIRRTRLFSTQRAFLNWGSVDKAEMSYHYGRYHRSSIVLWRGGERISFDVNDDLLKKVLPHLRAKVPRRRMSPELQSRLHGTTSLDWAPPPQKERARSFGVVLALLTAVVGIRTLGPDAGPIGLHTLLAWTACGLAWAALLTAMWWERRRPKALGRRDERREQQR